MLSTQKHLTTIDTIGHNNRTHRTHRTQSTQKHLTLFYRKLTENIFPIVFYCVYCGLFSLL